MAFGGVSIYAGLNLGGLFQPISAQLEQQSAPPQIVPLDLSILSLTAVQPSVPPSVRGPDVVPPWLVNDQGNQTLAHRINEVRNLTSFIDRNAPQVAAAGDNPDARTTFILFDALRKLETLALYAAEDATPTASLARLDAQFQKGLAEVRDFVESADTKDLTLLTGQQVTNVEPDIDLGTDSYSFTGRAVATGTRDDPLPGLTGTETFQINITKNGTTDTITVDLSQITGPLSINAIVNLANQQIAAVPLLDANGQPVLDANGQPVPKFVTRLEVVSDANYDHAIKVAGTSTETVSFTPGATAPTVYVAADRSDLRTTTTNAPDARVLRFDNVAGTIDQLLETTIAGTDADATAIAQAASPGASPVGAPTHVRAIATDSQGFVYTIGTTQGDFGSQINTASGEDVFLTKLDSNGNVVFTRLLGTSKNADGFSLAIDSADNVIVTGSTTDDLAAGAAIPGTDAFVAKFDSGGALQFVQQIDAAAESAGLAVTVDANDDIIVTGYTKGAIDAAHPGAGGRDVLVARFSGTTGARTDAAVIGTAGDERGAAVAIAADGNILVASREDGRAVLRKLDAANLSNVLFTQDLGSIGLAGDIAGIEVSGTDVFIAGTSDNGAFTGGAATVAQAAQGARDGFVLKLTDQGTGVTADTISFLGTTADDEIRDIEVGNGAVYVAGATRGDISGLGRRGSKDAFLARLDATTLAQQEIERFGKGLEENAATAIALDLDGPGVLDKLGLPLGSVDRVETRTIDVQTTARAGDFFKISINGRPARSITVQAGDTLDDIAARINRLSFANEIKASVTAGKLKIEALGSNSVDLIAGAQGQDLLAKFGLKPQRLLGADALFDINTGPKRPSDPVEIKVGGVFALKLDQPLSLKDKTAAKFTLAQIQDAIETTKRAFRSLTPNPFANQRPGLGEPIPGATLAKIQNYSLALARLQAGSLASPLSLFG